MKNPKTATYYPNGFSQVDWKNKYTQSFVDKIKLDILEYQHNNPHFSVEALLLFIGSRIKHYGLNNRYLPPKFKKGEPNHEPDAGRVETAAVQ